MKKKETLRIYNYDIPEQAEEAWNKLTDWYSKRKKESYEFKIQLPAILNLLGDLQGKRLIDIGCGPGIYSVEFAKRGADVLGIDISRKMLEEARKNAEPLSLKLTFCKADAYSIPCPNNSFDIAVIILAILNRKIIKEAVRTLKPDGLLLISDTHPIIEAIGEWENDKIGAPRIIRDYFSQGKKEWQIEYNSEKTLTLKYSTQTIEQCVNMIANTGLKILRIIEPKPMKSLKESDPKHYNRCSRIPYFIIYLARMN